MRQRCFFAAWNAIPPQRPASLRAFLCGITRNLALKRWEYLTADKRNIALQVPLEELEAVLPDDSLSPRLDEEVLGRCISDFLRRQKKPVRLVFLRRYWYFDSVEEIAERFGFSRSKVKSMLFRARSGLRAHLEREGIRL